MAACRSNGYKKVYRSYCRRDSRHLANVAFQKWEVVRRNLEWRKCESGNAEKGKVFIWVLEAQVTPCGNGLAVDPKDNFLGYRIQNRIKNDENGDDNP